MAPVLVSSPRSLVPGVTGVDPSSVGVGGDHGGTPTSYASDGNLSQNGH